MYSKALVRALTSIILLSGCLLACGPDATETAKACAESDLVAQCPIGTTATLEASAVSQCSGGTQGDLIETSGAVTGACFGTGSCRVVCEFQDPCPCGVASLSRDGVVCNVCEGGCGDGVCDPGETPENCSADCGERCVPGAARCQGDRIQSCTLQSIWEPARDCQMGLVCREDAGNAVCTGLGTCGDNLLNGSESDVDCGGACPDKCGDGMRCDSNADCGSQICAAGTCASSVCGDGVLQDGEECDAGSMNSDTGINACRTTCSVHFCGDGVKDSDELCDDGNGSDGDGCSSSCQLETGYRCAGQPSACVTFCGDGVVAGGEVCDDGNTSSGDYCAFDCSETTGRCGDARLQENEVCDDGNTNGGDGCAANCLSFTGECGNGEIEGNEVCDDGRQCTNGTDCTDDATVCDGLPDTSCITRDDDYCQSSCAVVTGSCGDGYEQGNEVCDDGNTANGDYCAADCQAECAPDGTNCPWRCGDGVLQNNEACDDANSNAGDYCSSNCQAITGTCGDGVVQSGEVCDDGNTLDGDYCSADCQSNCDGTCSTGFWRCGDGILQSNEACDDGNTDPSDYCSSNCQAITGFCGDGIRQGDEVCDDGNTSGDDYCAPDCTSNCDATAPSCPWRCGDGELQKNEACDDGNTNGGDYCSANCTFITGACGDGLMQANEACDTAIAVDCTSLVDARGVSYVGGQAQCENGCQTLVVESCIPHQVIDISPTYGCVVLKTGERRCWGSASDLWRVHPSGFEQVANSGQQVCGLRNGELVCKGAVNDTTLPLYPGSCTTNADCLSSQKCVNIPGQGPKCVAYCGGDDECTDPQFPSCIRHGWANMSFCSADPPTSVAGDAPDERFVQFSIDADYGCGVTVAGGVWCWGDTINPVTPADPGFLGQTFIQVATAPRFACGLRSNGTVHCWSAHGESPPSTGLLRDIVQIAVTDRSMCGIREDLTITCVPRVQGKRVFPPLDSFTFITGDHDYYCGLDLDGRAHCWRTAHQAPQVPALEVAPPPRDFVQVAVSDESELDYACGVTKDDEVVCWGEARLPQYIQVEAGRTHSCGLTFSGEIECWGDDTFGQVSGVPDRTFLTLAVGDDYSCAHATYVFGDSMAVCWGLGDVGQTDIPSIPEHTSHKLSVGDVHGCTAIAPDDTKCWGDTTSGAVNSRPPRISRQFDVGDGFHCSISEQPKFLSSFKPSCAGRDDEGQVSGLPVDCNGGRFVSFAAGEHHACATCADVTANALTFRDTACWGADQQGEATPPSPTAGYTMFDAGVLHTCGAGSFDQALQGVDCWGVSTGDPASGDYGQVSDAPTTGRFFDVSTGSYHACGVTVMGQTVCWGRNDSGQSSPPAYCPLYNGDPSLCSTCGPCGHGEGHCNDDTECEAGLTCTGSGEDFAMDASVKVCVSP